MLSAGSQLVIICPTFSGSRQGSLLIFSEAERCLMGAAVILAVLTDSDAVAFSTYLIDQLSTSRSYNMAEDKIFILPQLPAGVNAGSVPVLNAPSTSFVMVRGNRGVTVYMRQRIKLRTTSGKMHFSKNLARWSEGVTPTVCEIENLIAVSRCNYILLRNGIDPGEPGLRIPKWLYRMTNLNFELPSTDILFPEDPGDPVNVAVDFLQEEPATNCTGDTGHISDVPGHSAKERQVFGTADCRPRFIRSSMPVAGSGSHDVSIENQGVAAATSCALCWQVPGTTFPWAWSCVACSPAGIADGTPAGITNVSPVVTAEGSPAKFRTDGFPPAGVIASDPCSSWTLTYQITRPEQFSGPYTTPGFSLQSVSMSSMTALQGVTVTLNGSSAITGSLTDWSAGSRISHGFCGSGGRMPGGDGMDLPGLEQICNEYLDNNPQMKKNTRKQYRRLIRTYLAPRFQDFADLRKLTAASAAQLILVPQIRDEKISTAHATRNLLMAIVHQAQRIHDLSSLDNLNHLSQMGKIAKLSPIGDTEKPFAAMITGDIGLNISVIFTSFHQAVGNRKIRALLELSFHLCLRQSEILRIRMRDIHFDEHRLHICWTKTITAKSGGFDIPLNGITEELIRRTIVIRELEASASGELTCGGDLDGSNAGAETETVPTHPAQGKTSSDSGSETGSDSGSSSGASSEPASASDLRNRKVSGTGSPRSGVQTGGCASSLDGEAYLFAVKVKQFSPQDGKDCPAQLPSNTLTSNISRVPELRGKQTAHGIRALFRTWASRNGIDNDVAECVLSHKCWNRVKLAYNRDLRNYLYDQRRDVMEQWSAYIARNVGDASILKDKNES